jgi:hypothetical protein
MNWILHKIEDGSSFISVPNLLAQQEDLSYEARGLLIELLSRPQDWVVRKKQLLRSYCKGAKLDRLIRELKDGRFMYMYSFNDSKTGHFVGRWMVSNKPRTEIEFLDSLTKKDENFRFARHGQNPTRAKPDTGKSPPLHITDNIQTTEEINTTEEEQVSSPRKDLGEPSSTSLPTVDFKKRYPEESLPYKLSDLLIEMVNQRMPGQYARYLQTEESRYLLIQRNAKPIDLLLNRDHRDVNEVLEVLQWSQEDSFWKNNIRSGESFRRQYSVLLSRMIESGCGSLAPDSNPELTQRIIGSYRALIAYPSFSPSPVQHGKFILASARMMSFFEKYQEVDEFEWTSLLMRCLEKQYSDKGEKVYPGHYCSDHTWEVLMPQFLLEAGLVVWDEEE